MVAIGGPDYRDYDVPEDADPALVWASEVQCTGREERLEDCFFPEDFGRNVPQSGAGGPAASGVGILDAPCRFRDAASSPRGGGNYAVLSVMCRRFPIEGAP